MTQSHEIQVADPYNSGLLEQDNIQQQASVLDTLGKLSIARAVVKFAGSRDEGLIEHVHILDADGNQMDSDRPSGQVMAAYQVASNTLVSESQAHSLTVSDLLSDLAENFLSQIYGNWEVGDGMSGKLEIEVATGEITMTSVDGESKVDHDDPIIMTFDAVLSHSDSIIYPAFKQESIAILMESLYREGITLVTAEYEGSGDEGTALQIQAFKNNEPAQLTANIPPLAHEISPIQEKLITSYASQQPIVTLEQALDQALEHLVNSHHTGYENGEGGGGTITLNVETGFVTLEKWDRNDNTDESVLKFANPEIALAAIPASRYSAPRLS